MTTYILGSLLVIFVILFIIALFFIYKLANIIFVFEDDVTNFSNLLIDTNERLEQVQQIRALMGHPTAGAYISEALEEIRYCSFLLTTMIRKSKMLLKKDYTELEIDAELVPLHTRLEQLGVYDPEEDGEINIMSKQEAKETGQYVRQIKKEVSERDFY